jgi:class 3 adenylate cyclase
LTESLVRLGITKDRLTLLGAWQKAQQNSLLLAREAGPVCSATALSLEPWGQEAAQASNGQRDRCQGRGFVGCGATTPRWTAVCLAVEPVHRRPSGGSDEATWRVGHLADRLQIRNTGPVATALPGPTVRRHWGLRFAAYLGAVLFAVTVSVVFFQIVPVEYWREPVTGRYVWASGTAFVGFGTLIFLDRDQRANGLLLIAFGILTQLPVPPIMAFMPGTFDIWAIFLIHLNYILPVIVLALVLLRFPERRLQKRYERIFIAVMAMWLLSFQAIDAVTWPPRWATPENVAEWPWWIANGDLSEVALLAVDWGQLVFAAGLILLLALRILRTRGLDRRIYVPVHIASIVGMGMGVYTLVNGFQNNFAGSYALPQFYNGLSIALAVIPLMLFLANLGRRLLQLRIAGMVAEINLARTPDGIQTALRRALDEPNLEIYLWSREHERYVATDGHFSSGDNFPHRLTLDVIDQDGIASARIVADESVAHHRELLQAAREAGGMALDNSALQASLLATIELERSSRELSETLSRLLPTGLADRLRHEGGLRIGQSEIVEVTLLMSDVRGYSGIAETTDPSQLAVQVNEHRRAMNHVIMNHAGIVMQYVGDAVFAVFGPPTTSPSEHADQAFAAAQEMHRQQHQINKEWNTHGQPIFGMGIGLSTGKVAAALLGSDERFEYTLVGDTVNMAQRLQDLARPAGTTVLSEATWDNLTDLPDEYERITPQLIKGRRTPVTCYRVIMTAHNLRVSSDNN